jgi:hypothetical protein
LYRDLLLHRGQAHRTEATLVGQVKADRRKPCFGARSRDGQAYHHEVLVHLARYRIYAGHLARNAGRKVNPANLHPVGFDHPNVNLVPVDHKSRGYRKMKLHMSGLSPLQDRRNRRPARWTLGEPTIRVDPGV